MKRSRAPSALAAGQVASQTTTTVVTKKAKAARNNPSRNLSFVRTGQGFPKKITITHRYQDQHALNTGALGVTNSYYYSCNSMFDPNTTGAGHQPFYFDQLAAIYDHYTVIGSKLTLRVAKTDASTNVPVNVGILINDDTSGNTSLTALTEHPSSVYKVISTGNPVVTMTSKWSAKQTFGGSVLGNDNLQGTSGASPTEQSYYQIFINSSEMGSQTSVLLDVFIEYIAVWDELKDISSS